MKPERANDMRRSAGNEGPLITQRWLPGHGAASPITDRLSLLFVYGSLRRGFRAHGLMRRLSARFVGKGSVPGRLFHLGKFPGAVRARGSSPRVVGELYRLPDTLRAFRHLDLYEGEQYRRKVAAVELPGGRRTRAWVYWLESVPALGSPILGGDYTKAKRR